MHALCTHPDYVVSSNSLELLRPVFLWLTCHPVRGTSLQPWRLLLSLPSTAAQADLLLACVSCQQIKNPQLVERAFQACGAVAAAAGPLQRQPLATAMLPILARVSNELVKHGRDPRACYTAIERGFAADAPELQAAAGLTVSLLAENLGSSSALHLHELFTLCLNIISKYEYSTLSLSAFVALSLQWLHLPSHLTASALKTASKILDIHQTMKPDSKLYLPNLKANKTFQNLLYTDSKLTIVFKLYQTWERVRENEEKFKSWMDNFESVDDLLKLELVPFFFGIIMDRRQEEWYKDIVLKALKVVVTLVGVRKEVSVQLLPLLLYKLANDPAPAVKMECLKALPLMATTKENVPTIVSVFNKLKINKGVPTSFLIMLYTSLAETQVRCFPYLQEVLVEAAASRPDDLKWEVEIARALAVKRICEIRPTPHGLQLVSIISSTLSRGSDGAGIASSAALQALAVLWRCGAVAPAAAWRALRARRAPQPALCSLLSEIPALRTNTPEYSELARETARTLWELIAAGQPDAVEAACDALAHYRLEDYTLKDIPEIYRRTVKLPSSYCKTPADAARNPEDVLDYVPCEVWPEVFRYTNQAALAGVTRLAGRLAEREVKAYRKAPDQLPATSVVRGLMDCCRKQLNHPSFEYPDAVILAMLSALSTPRVLPPTEMSWLHTATAKGGPWRPAAWRVAARGPSSRRVIEECLKEAEEGKLEESEIIEVFELLPILCRNMPPNSLRAPIESCLHQAYQDTLKYKQRPANNQPSAETAEPLFAKLMELIKACLECDKIHDANRTLLSQIVETYFSIIEYENVAWPAYEAACCALPLQHIERMSSPSSWWEAPPAALRRAAAIRSLLARGGLAWLNDAIDAQAGQTTEQEHSLRCMFPALRGADADASSTRDWLLQLMARAQAVFTESDDESPKLYLCDVFALSVLAFSGLWACEPGDALLTNRSARFELMPAAVAQLCARAAWEEHTAQMLEWLWRAGAARQAARRAALALRHAPAAAQPRVWTRIETYFGRDLNSDE